MIFHAISEPVKKILKDPLFVLWCLSPTKESDERWKEYQEAHPEEQAVIAEARQIILSARMNTVHRSPQESSILWVRIETGMKQKHIRQRYLRLSRYAAACVFLLCITTFWIVWKMNTSVQADKDLLSTWQVDSIQTEVMLIRSGEEIVEIENNAIIAYDTAITIQAQGKEKSILKNINTVVKEPYNTLVVPRGRRSSLILADGSKVWINSGSVLYFPSSFNADERKIKVEGEIYIEVAKDASRPFYVETRQMTVNVLGTKFNVSAYPQDISQSVVLVEGSVGVKMAVSSSNIILSPRQRFSMYDDSYAIDEVDTYDYISWKDGVLHFRGETLDEVCQRLSRYYNIPIICSQAVADKRTMGKLLLFDDIEQVMLTLSILYNIDYTIEPSCIKIK